MQTEIILRMIIVRQWALLCGLLPIVRQVVGDEVQEQINQAVDGILAYEAMEEKAHGCREH